MDLRLSVIPLFYVAAIEIANHRFAVERICVHRTTCVTSDNVVQQTLFDKAPFCCHVGAAAPSSFQPLPRAKQSDEM